ncbi:hypothetical protein [Ideonella sp. B508-1]|uniref:hypothetical protein n=1 Tax=Ideonella sp. B508-1 TaxID=137716 RepID=UPI0011D1A4E1|nr:hypothetical protein [Ideonella sp. B508-1]
MRPVFAVIFLLAFGGCSYALQIEFFNGTLKPIIFCSIGEVKSECTTVPAQSVAALQWIAGEFTIESAGCVRLYALKPPEPLQDYVEIQEHVVKARIEPDGRLFLTPHRIGGFSNTIEQPSGYPAEPATTQGQC